jgi:hypothetical protein
MVVTIKKNVSESALGLDVVVQACNLSYSEAETGRTEVSGQSGQKISKDSISTNKS